MVRISLLSLLFFSSIFSFAQTFDSFRVTAWENAGLTTELQAPENQVNILDFGGINNGSTNNTSAYNAAVASLEGKAGTIYFPEGDYLFNSTLTVPDSVFIKGDGIESVLKFDLGGSGNLIQITGSIEQDEFLLSNTAGKGSLQLELIDASTLESGDIIRLYMFDEDYMYSSWAYGTLGQVVEIESIYGNTVTLLDPLNHTYSTSRSAYIKKLNPICAAGVECLSIKREDDADTQHSNVYFNNAYNCVVRNVEGERCDFGHVEVNSSAHLQIEGNYFHHGIGYGGGGRAYGVIFQTASSFCLAQNNVFEHLRHSMLIQSGANGNVFGYNYSADPFWEDGFLPSNSAGDAVLHGNYTFMNLFEGNTVQNIVVDASHGSNGPYNTFFRNRAELYGFFSDSGTPTDSMNVVGNEITNSGFPYGLFMVNGNGHYSYGNNVSGTATPSGTELMTTNSLYLDEQQLPAFLGNNTLPMIGYPLAINTHLLPAEQRFDNEAYTSCSAQIVTSVQHTVASKTGISLEGQLNTDLQLPIKIEYYALDGRLTHTETINALPYSLHATGSIQVLRLVDATGEMQTIKAPALLR